MSAPRFTAQRWTSTSSFGPTLETESLPTLGENRHAGRDRCWRWVITVLATFWVVVALSLLAAGLF